MQEVSILSEECKNFPGVRRMFYGFKSSFLSLGYPRHINQWRVTNIELKENKALGQLYFISESANFDESSADSNHGDVFRLSARGKILSTDELITTLLMAITREEVVLFIEDEKGNLRVIGNLERGAKLSIDITSNVINGSLFGYSFSVNYLSDGPAYWYSGVIEESENQGQLVPDGRDNIKLLDINVIPSLFTATQNKESISFTESGIDLNLVVNRLYIFDDEGTSLLENPNFVFKKPGNKKIFCYFFSNDSLLIGYKLIFIDILQAEYILDIIPNAERAYSPSRLLKENFNGALLRAVRNSDSDIRDIFPNNFGVFDKLDYDNWIGASFGRCVFVNNQAGSIATNALGSGTITHQPLIDFDNEAFLIGATLGGTWFLSHGGSNALMGGFSISYVFIPSSISDISNYLFYSNSPASRFTMLANLSTISLVSSGTGTVNTGIGASSNFRHFFVRCNDSEYEIYVNGILVRSGLSSSDVFSIQALIFQNGAKIKEYIAWPKRLNDYEIDELFNNINLAYGI
jgi:hypothetical protein